MALFEVRDGELIEQLPADFALLGLRERQDLQAYLFRNVEVLGERLKVIAQEFGSWEDARRRLDLLALDPEGHLVVIELKRTTDGGHAELQALRYAAMIAAMTFDDVVTAYIEALSTPAGQALLPAGADPREDLTAFLDVGDGEPPTLSDDVRIILVAADFGKELTTTVLWLNRFDRMDVRCIRLRPYDLSGRTLLDIEQVIPLKEAAEYQVRMRRKEAAVRHERTESRDMTPYVVTINDEVSEPLRKRRAILRVVHALRAAGVPAETIRTAIVGPRFLPVDGVFTDDDLRAAFIAAYPNAANAQRRWFFDEPVHDGGRTWVLSNQWGGENATRTMDALVEIAPPSARISYEPA